MAVFPVGNGSNSQTIATANRVQTRKKALSVLEKSLHFTEVAKPDQFERQNGKIVEFYRPANFSDATLVPTTETDLGTGLTYGNRIVRASMGNYTDYVMFTTAQLDFSPTPDLNDAADRLGYRGAKRVDDLMRACIDAEYEGMKVTALATYFTMRDCRNIRHRFKNSSIPGQSKFGGMYPCIASPVVTYDLTNDPTSGGFIDVNKYQRSASTPVTKYPVNDDHLTDVANCYIIESNNVYTRTSSNITYYRTYFFGDEGFAASTLNIKAPPLEQNSPMKARFTINTVTSGQPTKDDPEGLIGGFASYNIYFAPLCLDGNQYTGGTYRAATIEHQSTVA